MGAEIPNVKDRVGENSSRHLDDASAARLAAFAQAIGGKTREAAPATFLTVGRKGEFELLQRFGIPLSRVLHGEQEYEYLKPIRAGDQVEYVTQLINVLEKRGSTNFMQFLIFATDFTVSGEVVAKARTNIIHRGAAA